MNRRQLLKTITLAGLTPWVTSFAPWDPRPRYASSFIITDRPAEDGPRLVHLLGLDLAAAHIARTPMQPAAQDLSLIQHGGLVDPTIPGVSEPLAGFAAELRARPQPGSVLVSVEPRQETPQDVVIFEHDGQVYDQIPLHHNFARIEMPGVLGPTVFALQEGRLSVVTSSCRHQLCKKMGTRSGGRIICAPNRLVATLPRPASMGLDAMTG